MRYNSARNTGIFFLILFKNEHGCCYIHSSLWCRLGLCLGFVVMESLNCLIILLQDFRSYGDGLSIPMNLMFVTAMISLLACSSEEWNALLTSFLRLLFSLALLPPLPVFFSSAGFGSSLAGPKARCTLVRPFTLGSWHDSTNLSIFFRPHPCSPS